MRSAANSARVLRTEETTNYEVSKKVVNHVREAGVVRRLSVAVLVDGVWSAPGQDGQRQWQPRSPEELQQMTALVRSAIGFDEKRGDRVEVVNLRFAAAEDMPVAEAPFNLLGFGHIRFFHRRNRSVPGPGRPPGPSPL